jgi:hypothetical protein
LQPPKSALLPQFELQEYLLRNLKAALAWTTPYPNRLSHPDQLSLDESSRSLAVYAMANRILSLEHFG